MYPNRSGGLDDEMFARAGRWEAQVSVFAIVKLDAAGVVRGWNAGAESLKGYTEEQIVGQHFSRFYREGDRERGLPMQLLETAREVGTAEDTGWRVRRDGTEFWARVTISAIRDGEGACIGFVKIVRDLTPDKIAADEQVLLQRAFAHDLISPATALRGYLELLQEEIGPQNHLLQRAVDASEHLTAMATALLRDAVTQTGGADRSIDVSLLVRSAATLVLRDDAMSRIVFHRMDAAVIRGDVLALRRAVANVIENAAKYSDGVIEISVTDRTDTVEVAISDSGRGIHPDDLLTIAAEGERGRLAEAGDGGSGIGLSSVNRIIDHHHGTTTITSALGEGTTVTLTLPL